MEAQVNIYRHLLQILVIAILPGLAAPAAFPQAMKDDFLRYAGIQSVTGREARFIEFLKSLLPAAARPEIDNRGNLIVSIGAESVPPLLIVAAVDEPGFLVTDITEEGYLRVASPGGRGTSPLFAQFHEGHLVDISSKSGIVRGVVALPSSHLVRGRRESLTVDRMLIDIGARSKQEVIARGVEMLNPLAAVKDIAVLAGNRIAGPMLSRKFGAYALMEALKGIASLQGKHVVFAWATQSAMSNSGAARLARRFAPKRVLVIGSFQRSGGRGSGKDPVEVLDSGVLLPDPESPGGAGQLLRDCIKAAGRNVKVALSPTAAPPEARAFGRDADVLAAAIPVAFPGSLVETVDLDDLKQLIEFIKIAAGM